VFGGEDNTDCLLLGSKADSTTWLIPTPPFASGCRKTEVVNMDQDFNVCDGVVVPASALRQEHRRTRYGNLSDLPDEEMADPDELERVMYKELWWSIFSLPQQRWECSIRPNMDEDGRVNWGAFGTVDFESYRPQHSKLRYKAERMKEQLKDRVIGLRILSERIPGTAKYKVLRLVKKGWLDTDDIEDFDIWQLAVGYVRAWRLRREIEQMLKKSRQKQEEKAAEMWAAMGC